MKVKIEMKITVLDGSEKGRIFEHSEVRDTTRRYMGDLGIIEEIVVRWRHFIKDGEE